jgi:hypothetical protein
MDEINWTNKIFAQNSSFNHINTVTIWIPVLDQRKGGSRRESSVTWWHWNFNAGVTLQVAWLFRPGPRGVRSRLGRRRQTWTSTTSTRVWTACGARSSGWLGYGRRQASVAGPGTPVRYPYLSHILIPMYLKNVSQLISIILNTYPNYPTYLVIYPTYPLHAYVADKWPR